MGPRPGPRRGPRRRWRHRSGIAARVEGEAPARGRGGGVPFRRIAPILGASDPGPGRGGDGARRRPSDARAFGPSGALPGGSASSRGWMAWPVRGDDPAPATFHGSRRRSSWGRARRVEGTGDAPACPPPPIQGAVPAGRTMGDPSGVAVSRDGTGCRAERLRDGYRRADAARDGGPGTARGITHPAGRGRRAGVRRPAGAGWRAAPRPAGQSPVRITFASASKQPAAAATTWPSPRTSCPSRIGSTRPPASRTRRMPAARSQGFMPRSQ